MIRIRSGQGYAASSRHDAIAQTIAVLAADGTPIYANRTLLEYTGLTMDDVMAPGLHARISHPEDITR